MRGGKVRALLGGLGLAAVLFSANLTAAQSAYPLDHIERVIAPRGRVRCPKVRKVFYRGDIIRYHARVFVNPHFRERLQRFEKVVKDVAIEVYGRAPRSIRHIGTYNCRRIKAWPEFLSEHGIANGIDVAGFTFGSAPRRARAKLPKHLRRSFKVSVLKHWTAKQPRNEIHQRFLRLLVQRLVDRGDGVFRVLLGPGYPGHHNHFHFDMAPWQLVEFEPMPTKR
jgi:hypothetical protein